MKFEKWTAVLAGAGLVSLVSAATAEEKSSAVMTALASTTLSGYVDTSAQWNFETGNANPAPYKFNTPSKADGFNLDVVQLRIEKPLDESEWAAGYRVDLWMGPDANTLNTQSSLTQGDFAIRQAYVALRAPVANGLDFKMGVFDSIIGYESVESPNNPNYTRSYGHSIEPQTETGLLVSYRFSDLISASAGIANTVGPVINSRDFAPVQTVNPYAESYKAYMGSLAITAPESMGFLSGSTLYGGVVNGFNNSVLGSGLGIPSLNAYVGSTIATPVTGLRLGVAWDLLNVNSTFNNAKVEGDVWSIAGYASFQATEKLSFHGRFEYVTGDVDQPAGVSIGNFGGGNAIYATTVTAQYDLWKNVLSRIEFRWDHVEHGDAFGGTVAGSPDRADAYMLAANVIYKF
jgi:putative OmpL-like beta-barrel porin-2